MREEFWKLVSWGQVAALLLAASCLAAQHDAKKDRNYLGGEADSVKDWGAKDFLTAKASGQPLCVYIYDAKYKPNMASRYFEAKEVLGSADVREQLKPFLCIRLKSDCSDSKGWPGDLLARSFDGAVLMLATSDFAQKSVYDKQNKEFVNAAGLVAQLKAIVQYEEQRKALVAKMKLVPGPQSPPPLPTPPAPAADKGEKAPLSALEDKKLEKKPEKKKKTVDGPADE